MSGISRLHVVTYYFAFVLHVVTCLYMCFFKNAIILRIRARVCVYVYIYYIVYTFKIVYIHKKVYLFSIIFVKGLLFLCFLCLSLHKISCKSKK